MLDAPAAASLDPELFRLPGVARIERLDSGLTLCLLTNPQAPLVASALWYRVGARDEVSGQEGLAHFLEHMMFRGSRRYPEGEIDRLTQALGGSNNAFTSHDATAYHFSFAGDHWQEALAIEADRMAGLTLDASALELERQVILEELSLYEDQPWDALEQAVYREAFGVHPYGRPVIGWKESVQSIGPAELADFHARHYRADNALLVLAGAVDESALEVVCERFDGAPVGACRRQPVAPAAPAPGLARWERRRGEMDRVLWAFPAPGGDSPEAAAMRLLTAVLGSGKASRLNVRLVEEERLCTWVSVDLSEVQGPGLLTIAAEALPGVDSAGIEAAIARELAALRREPPRRSEVERAQRMLVADRVFETARIDQQALLAGQALTLFDWDYPERSVRRLLACSADDLIQAAAAWLDPQRSSTLGRFLAEPEASGRKAAE